MPIYWESEIEERIGRARRLCDRFADAAGYLDRQRAIDAADAVYNNDAVLGQMLQAWAEQMLPSIPVKVDDVVTRARACLDAPVPSFVQHNR